jgi:hypothetical protein
VAVGGQPHTLAVDDYDGDGAVDFTVLVSPGAGSVNVMYGDGSGAFAMGPEHGVHMDPTEYASRDLNGDGFPDLLGTLPQQGEILLRAGSAGRYFDNAGMLPYAFEATGAAAADFDGDGLAEIVVVSADEGVGRLHRWDAANGFAYGLPTVLLADFGLARVRPHDMNGDDWLDLVMGSHPGADTAALWLLLANPGGLDACQLTIAVDDAPSRFAPGHIDDDAKPDLVVTSTSGGTVTLLLAK